MNYYVLLVLFCLFALILCNMDALRRFQDGGAYEYLPLLMSNYLKRKVMKALSGIRGNFLDVKIRSPTKNQERSQILGYFLPKAARIKLS